MSRLSSAIVQRLRWLVVLAVLSAGLGCDQSSSQPARPKSVPASAFWVGGADGGVFVQVQAPAAGASRTRYSGSIYHPNGTIWYSGPLLLQPASAAPINLADREQFEAWDGTRLLLSGQRVMLAKPLDERSGGKR